MIKQKVFFKFFIAFNIFLSVIILALSFSSNSFIRPAVAEESTNSQGLSELNGSTEFHSKNPLGILSLKKILKDSTPVELLDINLSKYSAGSNFSLLTETLHNLNPNELAITLSKILLVDKKLFENIIYYDSVNLLGKLSVKDLTVALTYEVPSNRSYYSSYYKNETVQLIEYIDDQSLSLILNNLSSNDLIYLLENLNDRISSYSMDRALIVVSTENIKKIIENLNSTNTESNSVHNTIQEFFYDIENNSRDNLADAIFYNLISPDIIRGITTENIEKAYNTTEDIENISKDNLYALVYNLKYKGILDDLKNGDSYILKLLNLTSSKGIAFGLHSSFLPSSEIEYLLGKLPEYLLGKLPTKKMAEVLGVLAYAQQLREANEYWDNRWNSDNPYSGNGYSDNPYSGNGYSDNPYSGNGYSDNPYSGNGYSDNPGFSNSLGIPFEIENGFPSVNFALMLHSLLKSATLDFISEMPLTEYSPEDVEKALIGLPEDKKAAVLNKLHS
jgi:hypothetical protein